MGARNPLLLENDPLWYKDAIIYELHVKAFYDRDGDGIGDFRGLTEKIDYLEDLGVNAIWLLPFYPSPLKDDGYDISDYFNIHPDYGTLRDFRDFLKKAHDRGLRVITELVMNHTSDQHPWFRRARNARPGTRWRDFYVWSETPEPYKDARIIFKDFETSNWAWDQQAQAYYWHRFYSHQPDLNFDSPVVQRAVLRALDFWYGLGVDGLRLDAIPYLFEREGTNCENLPETYAFLRKLRTHVDGKFKNRMLLSEANQWPEDAVAYFGTGDMSHMAFHFPLMPRMFIALQMEDRFPIVDILDQTPKIPDTCQWALFLRNHDELTLEMVTDEERDYMYRVYARDPRARINLGIRRRLAPLMENNRARIELMNVLLFSLPGTPVIYYGDEIGMGDNYYLGDRNGVRTPMQWSPDRNAGFSKANPQRLYMPAIIDPEYHYESLNVENQQRNPSSLLRWMKRIIAMRKKSKALSRGSLEFLLPDNHKVLAFFRTYEDESILVITNLSKHFQVVELPLAPYEGCVPVEVASQNPFPVIKETPYVLTLGPHNYVWLSLREAEELRMGTISAEKAAPEIWTEHRWESVLEGETRRQLEERVLPAYVRSCRWFSAKARTIQKLDIVENMAVSGDSDGSHLLILVTRYAEGGHDMFVLPVSYAVTRQAERPTEVVVVEGMRVRLDSDWLTVKAGLIKEQFPQSIIARLHVGEDEGILYDALYDSRFRDALLTMIARRKRIRTAGGELVSFHGKTLRRFLAGSRGDNENLSLSSHVIKAEQSNTSVLYEDKFYFKLFRSLKEGVNPDREIVEFLTERIDFKNVPPFAGCIEYRRPGFDPVVIGLLQGFVQAQRDGWSFTIDALSRYFEQVLSRINEVSEAPAIPESLFDIALTSVPPLMLELVEGHYLEMVSLLGKRTGEMHLALGSSLEEPDFAPEPFSMLYQRAVYQSMRGLTRQVMELLKGSISTLPTDVLPFAERIAASEDELMARFRALLRKKLSAMKTRIHGDYHLGQVLFTGKDFVIIDFEGEPARSLTERRLKKSPLRDVAGMIRSFHYAAHFSLFKEASRRTEDIPVLAPWANVWYRSVSGVFLASYLETVKGAPFVPEETDDLRIMLGAFMVDKAVYELAYELNNRPEWVIVPLKGLIDLLELE
jgi:maltose alpha-D-glucosyltransferase/alpha-amylase